MENSHVRISSVFAYRGVAYILKSSELTSSTQQTPTTRFYRVYSISNLHSLAQFNIQLDHKCHFEQELISFMRAP